MLNIKDLRNRKGESQSDLAVVLGVSLRTIQNYESGKVDIPRKNIKKIAQHYDVDISHLISYNIQNELEFVNDNKDDVYEKLFSKKDCVDKLNELLSVLDKVHDEVLSLKMKIEK